MCVYKYQQGPITVENTTDHGRQGFMAINKPCPGAAPLAQVVYGPQIPVYHGLSINSPLFL